jgi:hypothetical protein
MREPGDADHGSEEAGQFFEAAGDAMKGFEEARRRAGERASQCGRSSGTRCEFHRHTAKQVAPQSRVRSAFENVTIAGLSYGRLRCYMLVTISGVEPEKKSHIMTAPKKSDTSAQKIAALKLDAANAEQAVESARARVQVAKQSWKQARTELKEAKIQAKQVRKTLKAEKKRAKHSSKRVSAKKGQ